MIKVGDTVLHRLSGLYYKCENTKQQRWMNQNHFYWLMPNNIVPESYFKKIL